MSFTPAQKEWLDLCGELSKSIARMDEQRKLLREEFVRAIRTAKLVNITQQQIADATGYSRQRIAQFLSEQFSS